MPPNFTDWRTYIIKQSFADKLKKDIKEYHNIKATANAITH